MWDNVVVIFVVLFIFIAVRFFFKQHELRIIFSRLKYFFNPLGLPEYKLLREELEKNNQYFRSLSESGKNRMVKKCFSFMKSKRFVGMSGLEVTDEMIATISGTAAQLTFGLKRSSFSYYHTIKIFPETFYSKFHGRDLKGGASTGGVLFFSWKDFREGYADNTDRYNLGLHEMAHALRVELKYGNNFDARFADYTDHWLDIAMPEFERMNNNNTSFLRDYAATNVEEFFAVCIEHFFEVPHDFKTSLPDVYNHLCFLLNQDPCSTNDDYRLDKNFINKINADKLRKPIPLKLKKNYKYDAWHWSANFIVGGLFVGLPVILLNLPHVLVKYSAVVLMIAVVAILITGFRGFFYSRGIFLFHHLVMFAILGAGVPLTATGLLLNRFVTAETSVQSYRIQAFTIKAVSSRVFRIEYKLQDDVYKDFLKVRTADPANYKVDLRNASEMIITTSEGLFGFTNIESRGLVIGNDTIMLNFKKY